LKRNFSPIIALSLGLSFLNFSSTAQADGSVSCDSDKSTIDFSNLSKIEEPCHFVRVIVFSDGIEMNVPDLGQTLVQADLLTSGIEQEKVVWQNLDGTIGASYLGEVNGFAMNQVTEANLFGWSLVDGGGGAAPDPGCASTSFQENGYRHAEAYKWWYKSDGESSAVALARVKEAVDQWRFPKNRCNLESFATNFKASFMGSTGTNSTMTLPGGCSTQTDNKNLISWGALPADTLGRTCTLVDNYQGLIIETDIRLKLFSSTAQSFFDLSDTSICGIGDYLLVTTVAHEVGHAIGLAHADQSSYQLMSPNSPECIHDFLGLAPGDYLGLKQHYGVKGLYEAV
jgi:hypothetical protein